MTRTKELRRSLFQELRLQSERQTGCLVVGEVAQAHDGSLGQAHAFIDAVAAAGAGAIKFQTHLAKHESTPAEPWRVQFSRQDERRYDYWRRMEFTEPQWLGLAEHARERGLVFLSSPFSVEAVDLLERIGVPAWKIASGEVTNVELLDAVLATGKPILLSSGMSTFEELDRTVRRITDAGVQLLVFQCTTAYPNAPAQVGLNVLQEIRERYGCLVGLSDHSATIFPSLAAATLGADALEVHVTLSRDMFGPDVVASLTPAELHQLAEGVRYIDEMLANPVDKDEVAAQMQPLRDLFGRSIVARRDLLAGELLTAEAVAFKKPGSGLAPEHLPELIGRRLARDVPADDLLATTDLEASV